jgi:MFS family permease
MGRAVLGLQFALGAVIVAFAASRALWLSEILLLLAGALMVMVFSLATSLAQLLAPNEMRGRVMSIYMVAFASAPTVLMVNGTLLSLVATGFFVHRRGVRDV